MTNPEQQQRPRAGSMVSGQMAAWSGSCGHSWSGRQQQVCR